MRLVRYPDPGSFLAAAGAGLEAAEVEHGLILGAVIALYSTPPGEDAPAPYLACVWDGDALALAALHATHQPLVVSAAAGSANGEAAALLARDLASTGSRPSHAIAPESTAEAFASAWCDAAGCSAEVAMRQRLHVLTEAADFRAVAGAMRRAGPADVATVGAWAWAFAREALGEPTETEARASAARRIAGGEVWIWDEDGEPRAMAATARPTPHGIAINSVYTPPAGRGRGHATALVAALSRRMLADGRRFCVLFTDLANPTSNAIYARIGYRPVTDLTLHRFTYPADG